MPRYDQFGLLLLTRQVETTPITLKSLRCYASVVRPLSRRPLPTALSTGLDTFYIQLCQTVDCPLVALIADLTTQITGLAAQVDSSRNNQVFYG